ncbi:MAG: class B sortase [Eggerthellaceae bacterium]|nr:class B sortase [Eggerthellaceae bacterium]
MKRETKNTSSNQMYRGKHAPRMIADDSAQGHLATVQPRTQRAVVMPKGSKKSGARNAVLNTIMVIAALVLITSLVVLVIILYGYLHGTKVYDDIANKAVIEQATTLEDMTIDWDYLRAQNKDVVGWIIVPGTTINYPIVQGRTDEEYLYQDFNHDEGLIVHKGSIFLHYDNKGDMSDDANFIFGHNMNDNTMFAHLRDMTEQDQFDATRDIYVLTPERNYHARTFAIDVVANTDVELLELNFDTIDKFDEYIAARVKSSEVPLPSDIDAHDFTKLFALLTCGDDYAATRVVLFGGVTDTAIPKNAHETQAGTKDESVAAIAKRLEENAA